MSLNDDTIAAQLNAMKELGILDAPQPISDKPMRVPIYRLLSESGEVLSKAETINRLNELFFKEKD